MKLQAALARLISSCVLVPALSASALAAGCLSNGCHQEVTKLKHMHGPIGAEMAGAQGCIMCHTPTGPACSAAKAGTFTLKGKDICQTCHAKGSGSQHAEASTNCLQCHAPHGSDTSPYMLRPKP